MHIFFCFKLGRGNGRGLVLTISCPFLLSFITLKNVLEFPYIIQTNSGEYMGKGRPMEKKIHSISFPFTVSLSAEFPYVSQLSKNRKEIYTKRYTHKKIKNPVHEQMKRLIFLKFTALAKSVSFKPKTHVLVVIKVYTKTRSSDAHNFAEGACDSLEKALGINDRWFSVYTIPFIDKESPRIRIEVYQNAN